MYIYVYVYVYMYMHIFIYIDLVLTLAHDSDRLLSPCRSEIGLYTILPLPILYGVL